MVNTRKIIFDTASQLFLERGYEQVTVNEICAACNITKSTFYYHVKSKQDIILQYYDNIVSDLTPMLSDMLTSSTYWDQLVLLFTHLADQMISLGTSINSQLFIINLHDNQRTFAIREQLKSVAVSIISRGQEAQQILNTEEPEKLFEAIAHMFTGYEVLWCINKGEYKWKQAFLAALERLLNVRPDLRQHQQG